MSDFAETEVAKSDYQTEVKENRIYDPLAKDQDGDGVIDRYDNDFRDSDVSYEPLGNKNPNFMKSRKRHLKERTILISSLQEKGQIRKRR